MTDDRPIRSYSHPATSVAVLEAVAEQGLRGQRILDVGAGEGYFASLVGARAEKDGLDPATVITACDLNPDNFRYSRCACERIDANGRLPFDDGSFDAACSIEVVEHLEDQFAFARELFRVVKPGGRAIITTPNILNINSRIRNLTCGFPLLFGPLKPDHDGAGDAVHASSGHIHPVSFYYLEYQFRRAGFADVRVRYDRHKSSAFGWLILLWPFLMVGFLAFRMRLARKQPANLAANRQSIALLNSIGMLTARTVVVEGIRAP
jgi:SAM-dependent methyltransferase